MLKQIQPGQLVVDMFAGAGPFAVPAARHRRAMVHANDLNPHAAVFLTANAARNRIPQGSLHVHNLDGRELVTRLLEDGVPRPHHVIMNLPGMFWVVQKKVPMFHGHKPLKGRRRPFSKCDKFISAESDWAKTFYMPSP